MAGECAGRGSRSRVSQRCRLAHKVEIWGTGRETKVSLGAKTQFKKLLEILEDLCGSNAQAPKLREWPGKQGKSWKEAVLICRRWGMSNCEQVHQQEKQAGRMRHPLGFFPLSPEAPFFWNSVLKTRLPLTELPVVWSTAYHSLTPLWAFLHFTNQFCHLKLV